jgi:hypothetical protein
MVDTCSVAEEAGCRWVVEADSRRGEETYMVVSLGACKVVGWKGVESSPDIVEGGGRR